MGSRYTLEPLVPAVKRNGSSFSLVIKRNFPTQFERINAPVFYFMEDAEAHECLEKLLSR